MSFIISVRSTRFWLVSFARAGGRAYSETRGGSRGPRHPHEAGISYHCTPLQVAPARAGG